MFMVDKEAEVMADIALRVQMFQHLKFKDIPLKKTLEKIIDEFNLSDVTIQEFFLLRSALETCNDYSISMSKFTKLYNGVACGSLKLEEIFAEYEVRNQFNSKINCLFAPKVLVTFLKDKAGIVGDFTASKLKQALVAVRYLDEKIMDICWDFLNEYSMAKSLEDLNGDYGKYFLSIWDRYLSYLRGEEDRRHYICEGMLGYGSTKKTQVEMANHFGVGKERVRQIQETIWAEFLSILDIDVEELEKYILKNLSIGVSLNEMFASLDEVLSDSVLKTVLERILGKEKFFTNLEKNLTISFLNDLILERAFPYEIDLLKENIAKFYSLSDELSINYIYSNLLKEKKIYLCDGGFAVSKTYIPIMQANAALGYPNGLSVEELEQRMKEIFIGYEEKVDKNFNVNQPACVGYIYLYEDGKYRAIKFLFEEYSKVDIERILNVIYNYLKGSTEEVKLRKVLRNCFDNSLNYYDLRYIVNRFGEQSKGILFDGKSSRDVVWLDPQS